MTQSQTDEQGWALISVLLVTASIALLAAAAQNATFTALRAQTIAWQSASRDAALDSAVNATVFALSNGQNWPLNGSRHYLYANGQAISVAVQDERGRIDLNAADVSVLKAAFMSAGLDDESATRIAERVEDWRTKAQDQLPYSGDRSNESAMIHPRHAPFQSVDELRLVRGVTPELFQRIGSVFTVYSGLPTVDQTVAAPQVKAILSKMDQHGREAISDARSTSLPMAGRALSVSAKMNGNASHTAVVVLTGDDAHPYIVLSWR